MPLTFKHPEEQITKCVQFLRTIYAQHGKKHALIAVSGGIDSALSTTLLVKALGAKNVFALSLPYDKQSSEDAAALVKWNAIPAENYHIINIKPLVDAAEQMIPDLKGKEFRRGNIMARARMMVVYDFAKKLDALVCGTENKSEEFLGYFTRFGDAASDIEPIHQYYKTQVRQLVTLVELPAVFLEKAPSAGLWEGQTDETEMGFSYEHADRVLEQLVDEAGGRRYVQLIEGVKLPEITAEIAGELADIPKKTITAVLERVHSQQFKREVPYVLE